MPDAVRSYKLSFWKQLYLRRQGTIENDMTDASLPADIRLNNAKTFYFNVRVIIDNQTQSHHNFLNQKLCHLVLDERVQQQQQYHQL
jgi:hypothetical protein